MYIIASLIVEIKKLELHLIYNYFSHNFHIIFRFHIYTPCIYSAPSISALSIVSYTCVCSGDNTQYYKHHGSPQLPQAAHYLTVG